jgi:hypothetical protein
LLSNHEQRKEKMGDRSNVNFITEKRTAAGHDTYLGLSVYLHWGGVDAQLKALEVAGLSGERCQ